MKTNAFFVLICAAFLGAGCSTVGKTVGTTAHIAGNLTKMSFGVAKTGVGAVVDVSAHAVRAGVDLADHASRKPVVAKAATAYVGGPTVTALATVAK